MKEKRLRWYNSKLLKVKYEEWKNGHNVCSSKEESLGPVFRIHGKTRSSEELCKLPLVHVPVNVVYFSVFGL